MTDNEIKSRKYKDKSDGVREMAGCLIKVIYESGFLEGIPVINDLIKTFKLVNGGRDQIFFKKVERFLNELGNISQTERQKLIDELNEDKKYADKFGVVLIEILDRMESEFKPEIAAKCFIAYVKEKINFEQLQHMLHALERVPSFEINKIAIFAKTDIDQPNQMEESTLLAYVNAGLGKNNGGFDGGRILPTELCTLFVDNDVLP